MLKRFGLFMAAMLVFSATVAVSLAQDDAAKPAPSAIDKLAQQETIARAAEPALVVVEYTLQYDKGEAPHGGGFTEKCPWCGRYHGEGIGEVIKEERALERPGLLVDDTHIFSSDVQIHPRFIKNIMVQRYSRDGKKQERVAAKISGYPKNQNGLVLELAAPLSGASPVTFDAARPGPFSLVALSESDGQWVVGVHDFGTSLVVAGDKELLSAPRGLIVDKNGAAVGFATGMEMPARENWKGNPLHWPMISATEMDSLLASLDQHAARGIVRVMLNFRSPKNAAPDQNYRSGNASAVQQQLGVLLDDQTVLVLTELKPAVTARLERIKVFTDPPTEAKFKASLTDYGAFVAQLEKPTSGAAMGLSKTNILDLKVAVLPTAQIILQGEKRVAYVQPRRIPAFNKGWRDNLYPDINGETRGLFLFDPAGNLLALPIARRQKASTEGRYSSSSDNWFITPIAQVATALADLKTNSDPDNVPLPEAQEDRLAWIGVEMQPMNTELARANNVSDQTSDGESGALVTFVYPDSPAAKVGVEAGWVLLRINAEGEPKPIDVHVEIDPFSEQAFPWERFDTLEEAYFDRVLQLSPWPRTENAVTRAITEIGFDKKYSVDFFHDGKIDTKNFTVTEGPPHFSTAPKFKQSALGLTVKDLTYEVRRYMQRTDKDPGVIIGKIELGSKAVKAGLKPFEVITHVNDQPVMNVQDFERLTRDQPELRLSIKRMTQGRIVKIKLASPTATQPASTAPTTRDAATKPDN